MGQKDCKGKKVVNLPTGESMLPFIPFAFLINTIVKGLGAVAAVGLREALWHKTLVKDYALFRNREDVSNIKSLKIYKMIQKKYNIDRYLIAIFIVLLLMISASFVLAKQETYCSVLDLDKIIIIKKYFSILSDLNCLNKYSVLLLIFSFIFIAVTSIFWQRKAFLGNVKSYVILIDQDRLLFVGSNFLIVSGLILSGFYYYEYFIKEIFIYTENYTYKKYLSANITPMVLLFVFIYCINAVLSLFYAAFLYRSIQSNQTLKEGYENFLEATSFSVMQKLSKGEAAHG